MNFQFYSSLIILMLFLRSSSLSAQENSFFPVGQTTTDLAISGGATFLLFGSLELTLVNNRRVSERIVFDFKPMVGLVNQIYLFEGNSTAYRFIYTGATIGALFGKESKFLEVSLGAAYFNGNRNAWGIGKSFIMPVGDIAYRNQKLSTPIRIGVGIPKGLFVSFIF